MKDLQYTVTEVLTQTGPVKYHRNVHSAKLCTVHVAQFTSSTAFSFILLACLLFAHERPVGTVGTHTLYVLQRLSTHSSRLVSNSAQSSSQIIVNKIDLFFLTLLIFFHPPPLDTSLDSLTPLSSASVLLFSS